MMIALASFGMSQPPTATPAEEEGLTDFSIEEVLEALADLEADTSEEIAPEAPTEDLLPLPPKAEAAPPVWWKATGTDAPEVAFPLDMPEISAPSADQVDDVMPKPAAKAAEGVPPSWWPAAEPEPEPKTVPEPETAAPQVAVGEEAPDAAKPAKDRPQQDQPPAPDAVPINDRPATPSAEPVPQPFVTENVAEPPASHRAAPDGLPDKPVDPLPRRSVAPILHAVAEAANLPSAPEAADELGRLQVVLHRDGEHMHITITAERPETLEMMRRHADQLQLELQQEGFAQTDLSFAEWAQPDDDDPPPSQPHAAEPIIFNLPAPLATSGLDIRM